MPGPSTLSNESLSPSGPDADAGPSEANGIARSVTKPVRFVGFWAAIALPFLQVPLLAYGLNGPETTLAFVALLALNFVALIVGHGYNTA